MQNNRTIEALKNELLKKAIILVLEKNNNQLLLTAEMLGISIEDLEHLIDSYSIDIGTKEDSDFINCGKLYFKDSISLTDPCYNKNIYLSDIYKCKSGNYNCMYSLIDEGEWGKRIAETQIVHEDYDIQEDALWEHAGYIGVDSGTAGFFENKPDFETPESWGNFCDLMKQGDVWKNEIEWTGFWTSSGYGDGSYDIFIVKEGEEIIAAKIIFIKY